MNILLPHTLFTVFYNYTFFSFNVQNIFIFTGDVGGAEIDGRVTFSQTLTEPSVPSTRVAYHFTGLKPGPHKLHVHQFGDLCSGDIDFVGGHFVGDGK